jgi:ribonuclease Z
MTQPSFPQSEPPQLAPSAQKPVSPAADGAAPAPAAGKEWPLVPPLAAVHTPYFHLLGYSVAGEESCVQAPELNIVFDIGKCPRPMLTSSYCLLTHGHIDHSAGLMYYLSQRFFQGMGPGTILCPAKIADGIEGIIRAWTALEGKLTEHRLVPMKVGDEFELRKGLFARAFATRHTVPSLGYTIIDRREKLKPELLAQNLPGHMLAAMRQRGEEITYTLDVPLLAYTGDTSMAETLLQPGVVDAKILLTECTFFDPEHRQRARVGQHMHVDDLVEALPKMKNELILLTHVSRRIALRAAKAILKKAMAKLENPPRVEFLMDYAQRLEVRPGKAAPLALPETPVGE